MSVTIEYVDPNLLKPDPYQPRRPDWNSQEVREEIERLAETYDAQDVINTIEVDEDNVIILGERRWRAALLKGLEKVPIRRKVKLSQKERFERQLIDDAQRKELNPQERVWAWATAIVNINTGENYTIDDIKKMYDDYESLLSLITASRGQEVVGQSALSRIIGVTPATISNYMSFFRVRKDLQDLFIDGKIDITYLSEVSRLKDDEEQKRIEKVLVGDFSKFAEEDREKRRFPRLLNLIDYVTAFNKELQRTAEERAKEIIEEKKDKEIEVKPSEEAVEKLAKKIAEKPKKTPADLAEATLLTGRGNVQSKIKKAKEEGVDTSELEKRLGEIKAKISKNPGEALEESKDLKKEVDKVVKEHKARVKAENSAKKVESEIEKAEDLGLDVGELKQRYDEKKNLISSDPDKASKEFDKLEQRAKEMIEDFEREQREAKIREEAKREAVRETKQKVKTELLQNDEFIEEAAKKFVEKEKREYTDTEEILKELGIPSVGKQVEHFVEGVAKMGVSSQPPKGPDREELINYIRGFLKRQGLGCPVCGEVGILWRCGHELE